MPQNEPALRLERRVHPRYPLECPCKIFHPATRRFVPGRTRDLSARGVLLEVPPTTHAAVGDEIALFIGDGPLAPAAAMVRSTVVRIEEGEESRRLALSIAPGDGALDAALAGPAARSA